MKGFKIVLLGVIFAVPQSFAADNLDTELYRLARLEREILSTRNAIRIKGREIQDLFKLQKERDFLKKENSKVKREYKHTIQNVRELKVKKAELTNELQELEAKNKKLSLAHGSMKEKVTRLENELLLRETEIKMGNLWNLDTLQPVGT